eukprot:TRINITY_DN11776_c0_g1_i1.p1 TRINITY_DN11776_c0_g1~~TRINITY_DN11776_c0_g1_i1.p1  ORF type:complete len:161 (-),score=22.39 TRINITY_DN11776_c0_g1_i1:40-522(-)
MNGRHDIDVSYDKAPQPNEANDVKYISSINSIEPKYTSISYDELEIDQSILGRGGFGTVRKGKWRGNAVAIKEVWIETAKGKKDKEQQTREFQNEATVFEKVKNHPNIVNFYGACIEEKLYLVTSLYSRGSVDYFIRRVQLRPATILRFARCCCWDSTST